MPAIKSTQRTRQRIVSRLTPAVILLLIAISLSVSSRSASASLPASAPPQPPSPTQPLHPFAAHKGQPLENGPAVRPAPPFTTTPSDLFVIDPHWRSPNIRANTDSTTFAQQEPSIGVNPNNHLNVVVAQKDERGAPGPGTDTKE